MTTIIHTNKAPEFPLPFSQAIVAGDFVYVSGQVGVIPETRIVAGETIEEQTIQCIRNVETILEASGLMFDHVIKVNAHLARGEDIPAYNRAYESVVNAPFPTRTTVVSGIGIYLIEIDVVAYAGSTRGNS